VALAILVMTRSCVVEQLSNACPHSFKDALRDEGLLNNRSSVGVSRIFTSLAKIGKLSYVFPVSI